MRQLMQIALAFACLAGVGEARAEDIGQAVTGITYFNRPGATPEDHRAALDRCAEVVRAMGDPSIGLLSAGATYNAAYSPAGNAGGAIVLAMIDSARVSAVIERAENTHYQNCMIAQGWRVIRLETNVGRRMARTAPVDLAQQLAPMIGAAEPEGDLIRQFNNDLAHAASARPVPVRDGRFINLSRLSLPNESAAAERRREARRMPSQQTREEAEAARRERRRQYEAEVAATLPVATSEAPLEDVKGDKGEPSETIVEVSASAEGEKPAGGGLSDDELLALPDGATLVAYRQRGAQGAVVFRRIDGARGDTFVVGASVPPPPARGRSEAPAILEDAVVVLALSPGRWRMESMRVGSVNVSLCMGSPAFDIAEGEVVYAGDFNFGADPFLPGLLLDESPRERFASTPHFAARLRAASYENGSTGVCESAQHLYAYEVPLAAASSP